jgi:hypothetical protein
MPKFKLDCRSCTPAQKRERGCIQDSLIPNTWEVDGWKFSQCPKKVVTRQSYEYILAYNFYKGGFLPNRNGWMQQSVKFIEAVMFIDGLENEEPRK